MLQIEDKVLRSYTSGDFIDLKEYNKRKKVFDVGRFHKEVFAYNAQVDCYKHGWALDFTVEADNIHDSQFFPVLLAKLEPSHLNSLLRIQATKHLVLLSFF